MTPITKADQFSGATLSQVRAAEQENKIPVC